MGSFKNQAFFWKILIYGFFTPKKKFTYILVNGLMANFNFQDFWAKILTFLLCKFYSLWSSNPKFWYFSSLMSWWKWAKLQKNRRWHSMGWYYTVVQIQGWAPTTIRVGWDLKYLGKVTYPHTCLMGPSFLKIPDLVL